MSAEIVRITVKAEMAWDDYVAKAERAKATADAADIAAAREAYAEFLSLYTPKAKRGFAKAMAMIYA